MAEIKWIKMSVDIFNNRKIRQIESMPNGDGIIAVWLKILCLAGTVNDSGMIYLTRDIPYNEATLATEFNRPLPLIQLALSTFQQFGMIEVVNNFICISNWEKYQSVDRMIEIREYNRLAQQKSREKRKELASVNDTSMTSQSCHDTDIDKELEVDKDKDKETKSADKPRRFIKPTVEEVTEYCTERGNKINPQSFVDWNESKGWRVGNSPMKDWKAAVRTWEQRDKAKAPNKQMVRYIHPDENGNPIEGWREV